MADEQTTQYEWRGDSHPPGWRCVGRIDIGDPADVARANDRGYRIGALYRAWDQRADESPRLADIYEAVRGQDVG